MYVFLTCVTLGIKYIDRKLGINTLTTGTSFTHLKFVVNQAFVTVDLERIFKLRLSQRHNML